MAGRNHRRPSNKYGYAGSTPFAPFCFSLAAWRLSACILPPDTKSIVQARGRRVEGKGARGEKPCAISSSAAHANTQAHAMLPVRGGDVAAFILLKKIRKGGKSRKLCES
jgi:hypothetical protein